MSSCFYIKKCDFVFRRGFRLVPTEEENMRKLAPNSPLASGTETTALCHQLHHTLMVTVTWRTVHSPAHQQDL